MRDTDKTEVFPLGAPIKQPEAPKPYRKVAEGVWQRPDGKLETQIPLPPLPTIWDQLYAQQAKKP